MASWRDVTREEPEFAGAVRARFDAHKHKTLATLRKDGSPRISGVEATFDGDELWLGMMPGSMKALDLRRDPRLALHSATLDPEVSDGDAKLSGRAEEANDPASMEAFATATGGQAPPPGSFHLFRVHVEEVVLTRVGDPPDHLVIETWQDGKALRRVERR